MLLLGIDLGTSFVKVSVVDAATQTTLATGQYPETEAEIISLQPGWAEQNPDQWWENVKQAILKCHSSGKYDPHDINAIGIAYQMHGLVLVDKDQHVLRNAIIWCDSRAVKTGDEAFRSIGKETCLTYLLNSPGNFTASKLAWVKTHEPHIYEKIDKVMLPGDFIAMKMTGECTTTVSAMSEAILWDFVTNQLSPDVLKFFGFDKKIFPAIQPLFASHGQLKKTVATRLLLKEGISVSYKAGDQPNNAFTLNVLEPGEVAATAGTSGVIYGVSDNLSYDTQSRINSFAHVNHSGEQRRVGVLLCINGTGIFNRWVKNLTGMNASYAWHNEAASKINPGSDGLVTFPFGNGVERMLSNHLVGAHIHNLDFNTHTPAHLVRAVQEGIAFSFRYGLDIMRSNGINPSVVRACKANLFLSEVFSRTFATVNDVALEFYEGDGSFGAAIGAGIGVRYFANQSDAGQNRRPIEVIQPSKRGEYEELYKNWRTLLIQHLEKFEKEALFS